MHHPAPKAIQISSSRGICLRSLGKRPLSIFPGVPDFAVLFRHGANHTQGLPTPLHWRGCPSSPRCPRLYLEFSQYDARGNQPHDRYHTPSSMVMGSSKFQPLPSQPRVYGMPGSINAHVGTYQHVIADGNGSSVQHHEVEIDIHAVPQPYIGAVITTQRRFQITPLSHLAEKLPGNSRRRLSFSGADWL